MRNIILLLTVFIMISHDASAASINVINGNPNSRIFVNGRHVADLNLRNYKLVPGSHNVKVIIGKDVVYSKQLNIQYDGEVVTLDTHAFVGVQHRPSSIPNRGAKKMEIQRLKEGFIKNENKNLISQIEKNHNISMSIPWTKI